MKPDILLYEDTPKYDSWLKLILSGVLALTFVLGVILISQDTEAAIAMFGIMLFDAVLFKAILPRRFQIFEDRLKILLGGLFCMNIPFSNIAQR
jgi:drug/metabolite transporter (DMT)-like permease